MELDSFVATAVLSHNPASHRHLRVCGASARDEQARERSAEQARSADGVNTIAN
jgi:hypothetical protein